MENKRPPYPTRSILITSEKSLETVAQVLRYLPIDDKKPIEIVIREQIKQRKKSQNDLMWAGLLNDMEDQAYLNGYTFSSDEWHTFFKKAFIPDETKLSIDEIELRIKNPIDYQKWKIDQNGDMVLTKYASTKNLTIFGASEYLEQCYAYGANLGVQFRASPSEVTRYGY